MNHNNLVTLNLKSRSVRGGNTNRILQVVIKFESNIDKKILSKA